MYGLTSYTCKGVDMNKKPLFFNGLMLVAVLTSSVVTLAQAGTDTASSKDRLITVLNPEITTSLADRVPLAPRLDSLDGKTIYLVDTNWEGMGQNSAVLEEMQAWFAENMPSVKTVIKVKRGFYAMEDKKSWQEIDDAGGDGVIIGVAG